MKYNVTKNGEVVKKNLSKKQAEEYCEKMNKEFMDSQEKVQKGKVKSGLPLRKSKYELYKVEVIKENVVRLTESDLMRIIKRVIKENEDFISDMGDNPVFEDFMDEIGRMYEDAQSVESIEELSGVEKDLNYLYSEIEMSEDLSNDEKDELMDNLGECFLIVDEMYWGLSDFSEDNM